MIYFTCSQCHEDLEAEDGIKGTKMKCPACWKEIEVPLVGLKVPDGRKGEKRERPVPSPATHSVGTLVVIFLLVLVFIGGGTAGVAWLLRGGEPARRPPCTVCKGAGTSTCAKCGGSKTQPCAAGCANGKITNVHGEKEDCPACAGRATVACQTCGGAGVYSCAHCYGLKVEGATPPPQPDVGKDPTRY